MAHRPVPFAPTMPGPFAVLFKLLRLSKNFLFFFRPLARPAEVVKRLVLEIRLVLARPPWYRLPCHQFNATDSRKPGTIGE